MQDLGEQLRRSRQEKNLTLEEIKNRTKIQLRYLEALEKGDPTPFAGEVYFKGALRNYAQVVGLDPEQVLAQYYQLKQEPLPEVQLPAEQDQKDQQAEQDQKARQAQQAHQAQQTQQAQPAPAPRRKRLSFNWPVLLLAAAILGATIWIAVSSNRELPDPLEVTPAPEEPSTEKPVSPPAEVPDEPPALEVIADPHQSTVAETVYTVSGTEKLEIKLNFTGSCWAYLFSDGRELYQQTFKSGQELSAEGSQKIWVRLGNPLAVRLAINGLSIEGLQEQTSSHNYLFLLQP